MSIAEQDPGRRRDLTRPTGELLPQVLVPYRAKNCEYLRTAVLEAGQDSVADGVWPASRSASRAKHR